MSIKRGSLCWVLLGGLAILAGIILTLNAGPGGTVVNVRARFISGYTLDVKDALGNPIPNKIVNDDPSAYFENVGNSIIQLMDSPKLGRCLFMSIVTDRTSPRHAEISLDSVVSAPSSSLPLSCTKPYFIYDPMHNVPPVSTVKLFMKAQGEWEMIADPTDPLGIPTLSPKDSSLNFLAMTDGQEAYVYVGFFYFDVPDLPETKKVDESAMDYWFADCLWAKVKAWDWDGQKVNTWTFTPVTEPFKHKAWDNSGNWCYHPEGAIPYMLYSNARLSCNHGTYNMPWQLEITRR